MIERMAELWACEAYGAELPGACFFDPAATSAALGSDHDRAAAFLSVEGKHCSEAGECRWRLDAERQRIFRIIHEGAANGDPEAIELAAAFPTPDGLLRAD